MPGAANQTRPSAPFLIRDLFALPRDHFKHSTPIAAESPAKSTA
jgi:hypothetical protein